MVKSIYPSIPMPGASLNTIIPTVEAMRQALTLIILNGLSPNPNYTPSETAQVFVTYAVLDDIAIILEAPNDGNVYGRQSRKWQNLSVAAAMKSLANPPASASTTFLMLGLGLVLTPNISKRGLMSVSGSVSNNTNNGETDLQLYYGTGAAPANGSPATGTAIGSVLPYEASTGGTTVPFEKTVLITNLTLGTPYWFDVAMKAVTGIGSVSNVDVVAHELV